MFTRIEYMHGTDHKKCNIPCKLRLVQSTVWAQSLIRDFEWLSEVRLPSFMQLQANFNLWWRSLSKVRLPSLIWILRVRLQVLLWTKFDLWHRSLCEVRLPNKEPNFAQIVWWIKLGNITLRSNTSLNHSQIKLGDLSLLKLLRASLRSNSTYNLKFAQIAWRVWDRFVWTEVDSQRLSHIRTYVHRANFKTKVGTNFQLKAKLEQTLSWELSWNKLEQTVSKLQVKQTTVVSFIVHAYGIIITTCWSVCLSAIVKECTNTMDDTKMNI